MQFSYLQPQLLLIDDSKVWDNKRQHTPVERTEAKILELALMQCNDKNKFIYFSLLFITDNTTIKLYWNDMYEIFSIEKKTADQSFPRKNENIML